MHQANTHTYTSILAFISQLTLQSASKPALLLTNHHLIMSQPKYDALIAEGESSDPSDHPHSHAYDGLLGDA
jgi:hypothetical protein